MHMLLQLVNPKYVMSEKGGASLPPGVGRIDPELMFKKWAELL